jgi:hypothetical protein
MTGTDANHPNLSVWATGFKAIAGSNLTCINLKVSSFNVDRHNSAIIPFLDLRTHLSFINLIATSSKLFFAVEGLSSCYRLDLGSKITSIFYPEK